MSKRFNRSVKIVGASRTDAGVHAHGQTFHFDLYPNDNLNRTKDDDDDDDETENKIEKEKHSLQKLAKSLNSMLRRDIRIWKLERAPLPTPVLLDNHQQQQQYQWHAIASSAKKLYSYRIYIHPSFNDPLMRYTRAHVHEPSFDLSQLNQTLQYFVGTHDFRAFGGAIEQNAKKKGLKGGAMEVNTIRTVYSIDFVKEKDDDSDDERFGLYRIDVMLNGALYKMVRNIVGTSLDLCKGKITIEQLLDLLGSIDNEGRQDKRQQLDRDRNPCKPAPPEGLTLEMVYYPDGF